MTNKKVIRDVDERISSHASGLTMMKREALLHMAEAAKAGIYHPNVGKSRRIAAIARAEIELLNRCDDDVHLDRLPSHLIKSTLWQSRSRRVDRDKMRGSMGEHGRPLPDVSRHDTLVSRYDTQDFSCTLASVS